MAASGGREAKGPRLTGGPLTVGQDWSPKGRGQGVVREARFQNSRAQAQGRSPETAPALLYEGDGKYFSEPGNPKGARYGAPGCVYQGPGKLS